jgi:sugar/nucleoside kinase (ribokinase family)
MAVPRVPPVTFGARRQPRTVTAARAGDDAATAGLLFGVLAGSDAEEAATIAARAAALKVAGHRRLWRHTTTARSN